MAPSVVAPRTFIYRHRWVMMLALLIACSLALLTNDGPRLTDERLAAHEQLPYFGARFDRIAPPLYDWQGVGIGEGQVLPMYPYQTADSSADLKLYITVQYIDPAGVPARLRQNRESLFAPEGLRVIPQFVKGDPIYLIKRPPGFALMIMLYSSKRQVDVRQLAEIVSGKINDCLPLVYDPNLYLKDRPQGRPEQPLEDYQEHLVLAAR